VILLLLFISIIIYGLLSEINQMYVCVHGVDGLTSTAWAVIALTLAMASVTIKPSTAWGIKYQPKNFFNGLTI